MLLSSALLMQPVALHAGAAKKTNRWLGGQPFGVKFYNDGVMVVDLEEFFSNGRYVCPARDGGLEKGDVIKKINGAGIRTNEECRRQPKTAAQIP